MEGEGKRSADILAFPASHHIHHIGETRDKESDVVTALLQLHWKKEFPLPSITIRLLYRRI